MKKDNRGGKRPGAGRPRKEQMVLPEQFQKKLSSIIKKKKRATGKSIYDVMVDMLYDKTVSDMTRVRIFKLITDCLIEKESPQVEEPKFRSPTIYLPKNSSKPEEAR